MSDRAVDDLNARLVQQRTAFEDKQVNTRTIPAFLALSLFQNYRLCRCPPNCLSSPARRDVVHYRGRSRHQTPRSRGPRPKPPTTQVGARPRRRRGRERAQASTSARGALLRAGTPRDFTSNHFKSPFRRGTPVLSFAYHAIHLDHLVTHAIEHARTYAGAPRRVTRREETRRARDFRERRGRLHGLHFGRFRPRRRS